MSQKQKKWFKSAFQDSSLSDGSSTPKKTRESVTIDLTQDCEDETSFKITKPTNGSIQRKKLKTTNPVSSNWIEIFEPRTITDLAVHPKKIVEVQDWFRHYEATRKKYPGQMLLMTGPAGAGKTASIKALAAEMKYEILEWITPVDVDLLRNGQLSNDNDANTYRESQVNLFKQFLFKSSRYRSVFDCLERRLIMVEDFPNVFIRESQGFEEILQDYRTFGKSPLIFVVTDSKSKKLNLAYNLFPENIRGQHQIAHISFNPISTTLMKKALSRICHLMQQGDLSEFYKVPAANIVESINLSSQGDIRNSVINLHFASLRGAPSLEISTITTNASKTNKKQKGKTLKSVGRDESITLMHALGRVFNPKFDENNIKPAKFKHIPEEIVDAFSSEPKMFVDFLHSNYLAHFSNIENTLKASDDLSLSDSLMSEYREDSVRHIGLNIAVRGLMVSNSNPVSGWLPVRGLKRLESQRGKLEEELRKLGVKYELSSNVLVSDYRTYARIIKSEG